MKILHVIPNLLKGGAQRLVIDICNEISKKESLECKILVLNKSNNEFHYCSSTLDITYCSVSFKLSIFKKNQINIDSYENFIDEFKPEIIHSHLYFSELVCHETQDQILNTFLIYTAIEVFLKRKNCLTFSPKKISMNFLKKKGY